MPKDILYLIPYNIRLPIIFGSFITVCYLNLDVGNFWHVWSGKGPTGISGILQEIKMDLQ